MFKENYGRQNSIEKKWWLCMTVKFVKNLAWQITSIEFMKERNFHSSVKIVVLLVASGFSGLKTMIFFTKLFQKLPFTYWTKTSFASFPIFFWVNKSRFFSTIHFFLAGEFSFSEVFQIQWLERISLFWKSRVHFTTQWSTQRKVQFMGFQRVSKDVLLLVNVVD